jgi:integrase
MALATNIVRRPGSSNYYVRKRMPKDLWGAFGNKLIWKSLGTPDQAEAKRRARAVLDQLDRDFDEMRTRTSMGEHDIQDAVWRRYNELIEADERLRQDQPDDEDLDEIWRILEAEFGADDIRAYHVLAGIRDQLERDQAERAGRFAVLKWASARGDTRPVAEEVTKLARAKRVNLIKGNPDHKRLSQGLMRAELEALQRAQERDQGDFSGVPRDPIVAPRIAVPKVASADTIMGQFDTYAQANPNSIKPDTLDYSRKCVAIFAESLPKDFPASKIDKRAVIAWHDLLREFPIKAAETREFKGRPIREVVDLNRKIGKPTLSRQSMNKYLSALGAFCNWLVKRGVIDVNPTTGMHDKLDKDAQPVRPYTPGELQAIFTSPIYEGFLSSEKDFLPGDQHADDWRRWLPLLALFTGARLGELAQLLVADVRDMHGHPVIVVTKEGDPMKSLKTKTSQRVIPVHPELVKLGFMSFHARAVEAGQERLFPEIQPDKRGFISGMPSGWYRRYVARIGVKQDRSVNFHSFRHGLTDACRRAGYLDAEFNFLLGHSDQKTATTRGYGSIPEGSLARRVEIIEAVRFPGLDLSHLYRR